MEPDEAADALRGLGTDEQEDLLARMPAEVHVRVAPLLGYGERPPAGS